MAMTAIRPVKCSACGHQQSILDVRFVNAQKRPDLKKKILQGTLFPMRCKQCGAELEQAQHCVYIDPIRPLFLELCAEGDSLRLPELQESLRGIHAVFRLVRSAEEMQEKIRIFDSGLDDRVVEIIRMLMIAQLEDQTPGLMQAKPVFMVEGGEPELSCLCRDGSERICPITQALCRDIQRQYLTEETAQTKALVIDGAWGYRILTQTEKG